MGGYAPRAREDSLRPRGFVEPPGRPLNFSVRRHRLRCAKREGNVISRQWRCLAHSNRSKDYVEHLRTETFPALRKIPGFVDASILSRGLGVGVEFLIVTRWESLSAIARFSGPDPEVAVLPTKAAEMMIEYDSRARHFEVIE